MNKLFSGSASSSSREFQSLLGFTPNQPELYQLAFRHKSISQTPANNNERLEFLGDAILTAILSDYLQERFPKESEGTLTTMRAKIESRSQLNKLARQLSVGEYLEVDQDVLNQTHLPYQHVLGNTLEALIGAIYQDQGYAFTRHYVIQLLETHLDLDNLLTKELNHKGRLLEWGQYKKRSVRFQVIEKQTNKGQDFFHVGAFIDDEMYGEGWGSSKKEAEQQAAHEALHQLG